MRLSKLNSNLEDQINQNNQLSETIIKYMEKQAKMKETLAVLQQESKELFIMFQEKEHNEETYETMIQDLQREMDRMRNHVIQIQNEPTSPGQSIMSTPRKPRSPVRD